MSLTEQLSQILDQYYDPQKNLKNIEEKNVDFADSKTLKKINFSEQKMMTKSPLNQGQQNFNQELEQLNYKKAEHDFDRAKHDFEFEKKYKPRSLHWSVWILIAYLFNFLIFRLLNHQYYLMLIAWNKTKSGLTTDNPLLFLNIVT